MGVEWKNLARVKDRPRYVELSAYHHVGPNLYSTGLSSNVGIQASVPITGYEQCVLHSMADSMARPPCLEHASPGPAATPLYLS